MPLGEDSILAEDTFKRSSVTVLVNEVEVVGCFKHIDVFDDVLVFFYICEDVNLINRALLKLFIFLETTYFDHLYSVLLPVILVYCSVDLTISPLTDYLVQRVVLNYTHHTTNIINKLKPNPTQHRLSAPL